MTFGSRLKAARKARKLTQEQVAARLDVDFSTVSKWETDAAKPGHNKLIALAELYGVDIGYLFDAEVAATDAGISPEMLDALKRATPEQREHFMKYLAGEVDTPVKYTEAETRFLDDVEYLTPEDLIERYSLKIGDRMATPQEIEEAIAFIKARRIMKAIE